MSGIQSYLSDHFPLRDPFMTLKTKYEMLTGREEINDIYLAKDGYYIEAYKTPKQQKRSSRSSRSCRMPSRPTRNRTSA